MQGDGIEREDGHQIVEKLMKIAADMCIYINSNICL